LQHAVDEPPPSYESAVCNTVPALAFGDPFNLGVLDDVARDRALAAQGDEARDSRQTGVGNRAFDAHLSDSVRALGFIDSID